MSKVVLGGGLSGLSSAYYLSKNLSNKITLFESSSRFGGWIKSQTVEDGIVFEQGPRTVRPKGLAGANTLALVEELGLAEWVRPIVTTHPTSKNRMIFCDGELRSLPSSVGSLFTTRKPFSRPLIVYLTRDLFAKNKKVKDESIYDFIERRFGKDIADYLISPLICGICAGNAKEISVKFLMEESFNYEQKYGSIIKGMIRNVFSGNKQNQENSGLVIRAKKEHWAVYSFKNGMEILPKTLENKLKQSSNVELKLNENCKEINFKNNTIEFHFEKNETIICDHLISSVSAQNLSKLLQNEHPKLSQMLHKIQSVTVGVVNLHFKKKLIKNEGFGFLVPPKENLPILGVIYDSCCFPVGENTVLTVMMGGYWFESQFKNNCSEEVLLKTALQQLRNILGITEEPANYKVNILRNCIPQYVVGHQENLRNINKYIKDNKLPISLCGSSYYGVGVNDVILSARQCIQHI